MIEWVEKAGGLSLIDWPGMTQVIIGETGEGYWLLGRRLPPMYEVVGYIPDSFAFCVCRDQSFFSPCSRFSSYTEIDAGPRSYLTCSRSCFWGVSNAIKQATVGSGNRGESGE